MKKKTYIIAPLTIAILVFIGVYLFLNYKDDITNLTVLEKRWIEANSDKKVDLEIVNNIPVLANNGNGVIFDFIESFETDTKLEFTKIPYLKENQPTTKSLRIRALNDGSLLSEKDLLITEDGYLALSKENERYDDISFLSEKVVGVFTDDVGEVSYYLKTCKNINYKTYTTIEELMEALTNDDVNIIIVPGLFYLDEIISNKDITINYYFTEMSKKYVLTLTEDNNKLNEIVKKYFENWKNKYYVDKYNSHYLDYYIEKNNINDKNRAEMLSKNYVYGYVDNPPYETKIDDGIAGISGEYIARIERLTGIKFELKKYKNLDALKEGIKGQEVDLYFDYFGSTNFNYKATMSPFIEKYVVLATTKNSSIITSFESLKNEKVNMLGNNVLYNYFKENSKTHIEEFASLDKLKSNGNLIIIDKEVYDYYRTNKFAKYEVLYQGYISGDYRFMVKNGNDNFYQLFNYMMSTNSYYKYRINGLNSLDISLIERTTFEELYLIVLGLVLLPILVVILVMLYLKNKKKSKELRREDRRKYTDILTSLKNRNYLNTNMKVWENSKVYPQSVVIVDLNNVKYVNDNYGHEAGDNLIVKAAAILVNTQLENSEIIRTDGNEFLIYLVGYTEKQIETYSKKLVKEFKELPYGFGAAVGFSMIVDDIKTLDDAINEATLEMRTNKEESK